MKKEKFAEGYCFKKIFIFFLIGCLFGTFYEEILWFITNGVWVNRQGLIYGPFSPIYGLPVVVYVALLGKKNKERPLWKTYIYSALLGGFSEFIISFIAELAFNTKFWDYTGYFLNIGGRTTIPFMLAWGLLGTFLMKVIYPFVSKWVEKMPRKIANPIYYIVFVFITLDVIITYTAFGRMTFRNNGQEPFTFVGRIYDQIYSNEFMNNKFPAMRLTVKKTSKPSNDNTNTINTTTNEIKNETVEESKIDETEVTITMQELEKVDFTNTEELKNFYNKYKEKIIEITGYVTNLGEDYFLEDSNNKATYVNIGNQDTYQEKIYAGGHTFNKENIQTINTLHQGQQITIKGKLAEDGWPINLKDVEILQ